MRVPFGSLAFIYFLFTASTTFGQSDRDWTVQLKCPQVFIENQGQYDAAVPEKGNQVRYAVDHGFGWQVFFTPTSVSYKIQRSESESKEEREENGEMFEEEHAWKIFTTCATMDWLGANASGHFVPGGVTPDYYTWSYESNNEFINLDRVYAYRKIHIDDLYPGIGLVYEAPGDRAIKYTLHLAAGANPAVIRQRWSGASPSLNAQGDLHLPSVYGELIDYAPRAWYADDSTQTIPCEYVLNGNEVHFQLGNYDSNRAIVIDPWTVNPALPAPFNRSYEVDCDAAGNVFVFGGGMGFNLKKYNAAGTLQWTHVSPWDTSNAWFGELLVLPAGDVFITSGSAAKIRRLTAAGATTFTNNGPFFNLDEYWTLTLNCDQTRLISGGTRIIGLISPQGHMFNINMANGNQVAGSPYVISAAGMDEIRALNIGANGVLYAMTNSNLFGVSNGFGINFSIANTYGFPYNSPQYKCVNVQGANILDASTTALYTHNGATIHRRDLNTGAILSSVAIPGGGFTGGFFGSGNANGGLVVDACGNVYVGSTNQVIKYDAVLNSLATLATTAVYDLHVAPGGVLLIGGPATLTSNTSLSPCGPKVVTCPILGAELSHFQASCESGRTSIRWATSTESSLKSFDAQRSADGANWKTIGTLAGTGNDNTGAVYQVKDEENFVPGERIYYRLKMEDLSGTFTYSGIAAVSECDAQDDRINVFPSVTDDKATVHFLSLEGGPHDLSIYDAKGALIHSNQVLTKEGPNEFEISMDDHKAGMYFIKLVDGQGKEWTGKVVKE